MCKFDTIEGRQYKVYLETSLISYLVARKSADGTIRANQESTMYWWTTERKNFDLFISQLIVNEASKGNPAEAKKRIHIVEQLPILSITGKAEEVARELILGGAFPKNAVEDALHVGIAAAHKIDFILTWNFKHLANVVAQNKMQSILNSMNIRLPVMCIPQELTGG